MSPLYTVFRFHSAKNDFYAHYFKSNHWHGYLRKVSNSGARHDRMSISITDFMDMPVPQPDEKEQQAIVDCLDSLDKLIGSESRRVTALKAHRAGLMDKLLAAPEAWDGP
jgi:type I restriction enzyme S subunit